MAANIAMNVAATAARNPAVQQGARDIANAAVGVTMDNLVSKEREVSARMQNLKERQQQVLQALESLRPNWPGHFLCIGPVVYHNIEKAIPADRIGYAKASYSCYYFTILILVYNLICCIAAVASENKSSSSTSYTGQMVASVIHLLGIPGAFIVWHYQIYTAIQPRGPLSRYGKAYLGLVVAILYNAFMTVGLSGYGGAGFLFATDLKDSKTSSAPYYMSIVCGLCWLLQGIFFVLSGLFRLRRFHNQDKAAQNPIASAVGAVKSAMGVAAMAL